MLAYVEFYDLNDENTSVYLDKGKENIGRE